MSMTSHDDKSLTTNEKADAIDFLLAIDRPITPSDFQEAGEIGVKLDSFALHAIEEGSVNLSNKLFTRLDVTSHRRTLTQEELRMAVNAFMAERYGIAESSEETLRSCFSCQEGFSSWDDLFLHKHQRHGGPKPIPRVVERPHSATTEGEAVIEDTSATMGLDLSGLPDGRYALPDTSGKSTTLFLMVKRVRRTVYRDRRYTYGKIITGGETVSAGTIEVKTWSSDAKELIGEQRPGDVYRGKHEEELSLCMKAPEAFGKLFGQLIGSCCICGKTLTDDVSRAIGMGLECEKKTTYFKDVPKSFVPECPVCQQDNIVSHGKVKNFRHSDRRTTYECPEFHTWDLDKKGNLLHHSGY